MSQSFGDERFQRVVGYLHELPHEERERCLQYITQVRQALSDDGRDTEGDEIVDPGDVVSERLASIELLLGDVHHATTTQESDVEQILRETVQIYNNLRATLLQRQGESSPEEQAAFSGALDMVRDLLARWQAREMGPDDMNQRGFARVVGRRETDDPQADRTIHHVHQVGFVYAPAGEEEERVLEQAQVVMVRYQPNAGA